VAAVLLAIVAVIVPLVLEARLEWLLVAVAATTIYAVLPNFKKKPN
jgi:hypothetical protein